MASSVVFLLTCAFASGARPLVSRRGFAAAACGAAAAPPLAAVASGVFDGEYADPNHPDGFRRITSSGAEAQIVGQDEPGAPQWKIAGVVDGDMLALVVEAGSVQPPEGVTMEDLGDGKYVQIFRGKRTATGIAWPDGNSWTRR